MSASNEKNTAPEEKTMSREEKRLHDEQVSRRNTVVYTVVGVVAALLVAALLIWDSGIFQRKAAAVTIDGEKYTAADVLYYYAGQYQTAYQYAAYGMSSFDTTKDPKDQVYDEESGQTWHEYFIEQALDSLKTYVTVEKKAKADGYAESQEVEGLLRPVQGQYEDLAGHVQLLQHEELSSGRVRPHDDREGFRPLPGAGALCERLYRTPCRAVILTPTSSWRTTPKEHADQLDSFHFDQLTLRASVSTTDADGNTIEMTDDEKAAKLEEAKAEMKALAEEILARVDAGEDMEALAEEYADQIYSAQLDTTRTGTGLNASLSSWFLSADRKAGDTTLGEYDGGSSAYTYYVARFISRQRDESATANVRHILFSGEDEESKAQAKTQAEAMLDSWKKGEATEDSFAQLARDNSADTNSASNGGLIENITPTSSYVENFLNWSVDPQPPARRHRDRGDRVWLPCDVLLLLGRSPVAADCRKRPAQRRYEPVAGRSAGRRCRPAGVWHQPRVQKLSERALRIFGGPVFLFS